MHKSVNEGPHGRRKRLVERVPRLSCVEKATAQRSAWPFVAALQAHLFQKAKLCISPICKKENVEMGPI